MKITLMYSVITKEGAVVPNVSEVFTCENTDESKRHARERWVELNKADFIANLKYKIDEVPTRRVVRVRYEPNGTIYTFEVNFPVKRHEGLEVDDLDYPGRRKYVFAVEADRMVEESNLGFDVRRLRKAYKAS